MFRDLKNEILSMITLIKNKVVSIIKEDIELVKNYPGLFFLSSFYLVAIFHAGLTLESSISTVMIPVVIYTFINLGIEHRTKTSKHEKMRYKDINNVALMSYGIIYIVAGWILEYHRENPNFFYQLPESLLNFFIYWIINI